VNARGLAGAGLGRNLSSLSQYSVFWRSYVASGTLVHSVWLSQLLKIGGWREVLFPGLTLVAFVGVAVVRAWRRQPEFPRRVIFGYFLLAVLGAWASMGPRAGLYRLLALMPGMSLLRAPMRFGVIVTFAFAVIAAFGVRRLARRAIMAALLLLLVVGELLVVWPLVKAPRIPEAYRILAAAPRGSVVVEFPFPYQSPAYWRHSKAMYLSTYYWLPLVNGYSDHWPDDFQEIALPINDFPDPESFAIMKAYHVRYVVWDTVPPNYVREYYQILKDRFPPYAENLRRLTGPDDPVWLYEIVKWPDTPRPGGGQ
jgi:hypothetical protein